MIYQIIFIFTLIILLMILIGSYVAEKRDRRPQDSDPMHKDDSDMF
jgi:uncharacterized membrane protein